MIIMLTGVARSGKDTVGQYLCHQYGFARVSFADAIRAFLVAQDPWLPDGRPVSVALAQCGGNWEALKGQTGVRELLQRTGTDAAREIISQDVWKDLAMKQVAQHDRRGVVITDCRYSDEFHYVRHRSLRRVVLWEIQRPGYEPVNDHVSDAGVEDDLVRVVLQNDGTITDLQHKVDGILIQYLVSG